MHHTQATLHAALPAVMLLGAAVPNPAPCGCWTLCLPLTRSRSGPLTLGRCVPLSFGAFGQVWVCRNFLAQPLQQPHSCLDAGAGLDVCVDVCRCRPAVLGRRHKACHLSLCRRVRRLGHWRRENARTSIWQAACHARTVPWTCRRLSLSLAPVRLGRCLPFATAEKLIRDPDAPALPQLAHGRRSGGWIGARLEQRREGATPATWFQHLKTCTRCVSTRHPRDLPRPRPA